MARHKIPGIENSDCSSSKTRVPPQLTFISMSNSEKINLCTSLKVYTMFIFGILASWKCDFCSFVNSSCEVKDCGYICVGIWIIYKDHLFLSLIIAKWLFLKTVYIFICTVYSVWPILQTIIGMELTELVKKCGKYETWAAANSKLPYFPMYRFTNFTTKLSIKQSFTCCVNL